MAYLKKMTQHSPVEAMKNVKVASSRDPVTYTTEKKPDNADLTNSVLKSEFSIVSICGTCLH
jgi:hypothetical protein